MAANSLCTAHGHPCGDPPARRCPCRVRLQACLLPESEAVPKTLLQKMHPNRRNLADLLVRYCSMCGCAGTGSSRDWAWSIAHSSESGARGGGSLPGTLFSQVEAYRERKALGVDHNMELRALFAAIPLDSFRFFRPPGEGTVEAMRGTIQGVFAPKRRIIRKRKRAWVPIRAPNDLILRVPGSP